MSPVNAARLERLRCHCAFDFAQKARASQRLVRGNLIHRGGSPHRASREKIVGAFIDKVRSPIVAKGYIEGEELHSFVVTDGAEEAVWAARI